MWLFILAYPVFVKYTVMYIKSDPHQNEWIKETVSNQATVFEDLRDHSSQVGGLDLARLLTRLGPLPALSDAGEGAVHAGEEEQQLEHQHHRRHDQAEHVARGSVPLVCGGTEKFVPAVNEAMRSADGQGQVAQLRLRGGKQENIKTQGSHFRK